MPGLLSRWFGRAQRTEARPARGPLFREGADDPQGPVELGGELELTAGDLADVDEVRALLRERRPASGAGADALWAEIEAALEHEGLRLPPAPESILRAQKLLDQPDVAIPEIARLLESDPALATKLVGVANSPFFAGLGEVRSATDAIVRMGVRQTRHLLLTVALRGRVLRVRVPGFEDAPGALWHRATSTGAAAQLLGASAQLDPDAAFLAGLVQDMGQVAVLMAASEAQRELGPGQTLDRHVVEAAMQQLHEPLGGLLCRSWHLPPEISAAVAHHHSPESAPAAAEPLARTLRAADALASHLDGDADPDQVTESAAMLGVGADEVEVLIEETREALAELRKQL